MDDPSEDDRAEPRFETLAVGAGEDPRTGRHGTGDVTVPIHLASTFAVDGIDADRPVDEFDPRANEYVYGRLQNPTRLALEDRLAALEGAEHAFAYASGTAAIFTAMVATLRPGDHVVVFDDLYSGTKKLLEKVVAERMAVETSFVDAREPDNVAAAIREETALVWMESPTNPTMKLCDIAAIADLAAEAGVPLGVDNTFASPYFQNPLALGADVVAHSTTKYLNGHSDSIGGALVTDDDALAEELGFLQRIGMGNVMGPFDAYQVLRGSKTLPARMRTHEANAQVIAEYLADHDHVEVVHYPGLPSHPQHDLATTQMSGYGGILSFELAGGLAEATRFLEAVEEITLAVSLGGVETLIEHPASMTHSTLSAADREATGITESLVRLSVGIEHVDDLIEDLERGFDALEAELATAE